MEIMVEFIMLGEEFPVDDYLNNSSIKDGDVFRKGDVVLLGENKERSRIEKYSGICYSTGYKKTISVEQVFEEMYNKLKDNTDTLLDYKQKYNLETKFVVVINLTDNPEIFISEKIVHFASKLGAAIEFDTYLDYEKFEPSCLALD